MCKVSIIIPIYNTSKYLPMCLKSLISQTLQDVEIICINDGSTDNSLDIINKYASTDKRIKVVNQKNEGIGFSRNLGISMAKGEYITFVDSDDYLEPIAYELAYNKAKENVADIVIFGANCIVENHEISKDTIKYFDLSSYFEDKEIPPCFTYKEIKDKLLKVSWNIWNKIYKLEFVKQNKIEFINTYFQDSPFHLESIISADRISFINEKLYNYRIETPTSITNTSSLSRKVFDFFIVLKEIKSMLFRLGKFNEFEKDYLEFKLVILNSKLNSITDEEIKKDFFREIMNSISGDGYTVQQLLSFNFALAEKHFLYSLT